MRVAAAVVGSLLASVLTLGGVAVWLRLRDPVSALPRETTGDLPRVDEVVGREGGRSLTRVTLEGSSVGAVRVFVSRPDPAPPEPVPLLVVVAGWRTRPDAISLLGDLGPNAVVWFEWPFPPDLRWGRGLVRRIPDLHRRTLSVPGQLDAVLRWASEQAWVDRERVSLLGYSLGALVVPAAQRLAQERGEPTGWTVLAYGGAPIGAVLEAIPEIRGSRVRPAIRIAADLLLRPVEPSIHLPELRGRFLLLGGREDPVIPAEAAERMRQLTPHPRTIVLFEGEHVGVGAKRRKLLDAVVVATKAWLVDQGAIAPVPIPDG